MAADCEVRHFVRSILRLAKAHQVNLKQRENSACKLSRASKILSLALTFAY